MAALIEAVEKFERLSFEPSLARRNAERFSAHRFRRELRAFVVARWQAFSG